MPEPLLRVVDLVKHFRNANSRETVHAVNGVSFDLNAGETMGLVGESGSGKSTIGRCILRLQRPTSGQIWFDGRDIATLSEASVRPLRGELQIVFQDPYSTLNPRMRVGNIISELVQLHTDLEPPERRRRVRDLAEQVHLTPDLLTRFPNELSGGQLQRVCIARALAPSPRLIVLDEPTSSLDLSVRAGIIRLLQELQRTTNVAMLFISHDLETVQLISRRILVLYLGSAVEEGPSANVFQRAAHPYSQALLSANLQPDPKIKMQRHVLQGEVPSPINLPPGCPFAPRCPVAVERCSEKPPGVETIGEEHRAACLRISEGGNRIGLGTGPLQ